VDSKVDETPPEARLVARPSCGPVPLETTLDASGSADRETHIMDYAWDFDGDGMEDTLTTESSLIYTYTEVGTLFAEVRVTNRDSLSGSAIVEIWALSVDADPSICSYPHRQSERIRGIEYTLGLNAGTFTHGDTLRFFYQIANERSGTVEFPLHWTCPADFYVFEGSCSTLNASECRKKWQYTDHVTCSNRPSTFVIAPGESEDFTTEWTPQITLSTGDFTAFALLYHGPANPSDSTIVWVGFQVD